MEELCHTISFNTAQLAAFTHNIHNKNFITRHFYVVKKYQGLLKTRKPSSGLCYGVYCASAMHCLQGGKGTWRKMGSAGLCRPCSQPPRKQANKRVWPMGKSQRLRSRRVKSPKQSFLGSDSTAVTQCLPKLIIL